MQSQPLLSKNIHLLRHANREVFGMRKLCKFIGGFGKTLTPYPLSTTRHFFSSSSSSASASFAIKNVTKSNFEPTLVDLRRHVKDADFIAVDLEITGVTSAPWRESLEFDRFDIQYLKVKDSLTNSPSFSSAFAPSAGIPISSRSLLIRTTFTSFHAKKLKGMIHPMSFFARQLPLIS